MEKSKYFKLCHTHFEKVGKFQRSVFNRIITTDKRTDVWSRPSCIYTQISSPKKSWFFPPIENTYQNLFDFCLPLFYATFQCGRYSVFKKSLKSFFYPEKVKKQASKEYDGFIGQKILKL